MTSLINTIEKLIKREKTTPERKKKDDSKKSSSEILSELFSAFNADPPKIDEVSVKKSKKSKKKHKKEKKKRSRSSSSSSDSDDSDYSHKRKKRKKSKSKKHKDRSPSRSRTPVTTKSETPKLKYEHKHVKSENALEETKKEPKEKTKRRASIKTEDTNNIQVTVNSSDANLIPMPESPQEIKLQSKKRNHSSSSSSDKDDSDYSHKHKKRKKSKSKKHKDRSPSHSRTSVTIKSETPKVKYEYKHVKTENAVEETKTEPKENTKRCASIKVEDANNLQVTVNSIDASLIPMPESPQGTKPALDDLRLKLDSKKLESSADNDKCRSKIQIKNLKFSTVFEETVKKAEEEARKQAEKYEEGEYTGSSSSSAVEEVLNLEFPKSSNLGGMIKKPTTDDNILRHETESSRSKKSKHSESSHRTSRRDRSRSRKRSHSKSRRSRSGSRRRRHRSNSKSRRRSRSRHRSTSRSKRRSNSRSRARARHHSPRHHSPKHRTRRSRSPTGVRLADSEKKRLLEVARRNAINMLKNGAVPAGAAALPPHTRTQVMAAIQSGGKSVDELTDFCKHLSKKEALGELSSVSSNDEGMSENEDTIAFHHPFLVKEKAPIVMNIRGGAPLPIKTNPLPIANKDELRLQFPVSSGSQHRDTEWVPVSPKKDNMQVAKLNSKPAPKSTPQNSTDTSKPEPLAITAPPEPNPPPYMNSFTTPTSLTTVPALPAPGPQAYPPGIEPPNIDVASIVSQKLSMIRREQEQLEISSSQGFGWSKDCALGQFTGSTGVQILTPRELASGTQAWAKKDQLVRAAPVEGGMGMHLLQKMGWTPGQGLGKEGTGTLQPLLLEVKLDTRGLQAKEEVSSRNNRHGIKPQRHGGGRRGPAPLVAGGKHPVSLLGEYCSKRKLGPPEYNLCFECGPDHKKNFLFKVKVAGVEYQPAVASANKKQAKADAALLVLQKLGIVNQ